jgi:serine protease Do
MLSRISRYPRPAFAGLRPLCLTLISSGILWNAFTAPALSEDGPASPAANESQQEQSVEENERSAAVDLKTEESANDHPSADQKANTNEASESKQASDPDRASKQDRNQSKKAMVDGDAPALGIFVGSCPGNAVCVLDTIPGSPADHAGVQPGDYILSINEKKVSSPEKLKQAIEQMKPGESVKVTLWRQGDETTEEMMLASKVDQLPDSHRAWLGVMLSPTDKGVQVESVMHNSPADESGIEEGDSIIKINDKAISDTGSFMQCIEKLGPDAEVTMVVEREGEEKTLQATLGHMEDAPLATLRHLKRMHAANMNSSSNRQGENEDDQWMDEAFDELRQRVRSLEKQVKEMESSVQGSHEAEDDVSSYSTSNETLVVQRRGRGHYSSPYRGNIYHRNAYRSGYRGGYPAYRAPGYSYYRYGGVPYYYGGNYGSRYGYGNRYGYGYGYGAPRGGIQIGRNLGIFW